MSLKSFHSLINHLVALVWLVNGFLCKVLNLVPRHEKIVGIILGREYSSTLTLIIGLLEILLGIWIFSKYRSKECTIFQIIIVLTMNIIEFSLVPNHLLWGKLNLLFAIVFIVVIWFNEFRLKKRLQ